MPISQRIRCCRERGAAPVFRIAEPNSRHDDGIHGGDDARLVHIFNGFLWETILTKDLGQDLFLRGSHISV